MEDKINKFLIRKLTPLSNIDNRYPLKKFIKTPLRMVDDIFYSNEKSRHLRRFSPVRMGNFKKAMRKVDC